MQTTVSNMSEVSSKNPILIFDIGTGGLKLGHSQMSREDPTTGVPYEYPSCYALPLQETNAKGVKNEVKYGPDALLHDATRQRYWPLKNGTINVEDPNAEAHLQKIFEKCYERLQEMLYPGQAIDNTDFRQSHDVIVTSSSNPPGSYLKWLRQLFFDTFRCPRWKLMTQASLTLFAATTPDGAVYDIGHGVAHVVSIIDYNTIMNSVISKNFAGRELSDYLTNTILGGAALPPGGGNWSDPKWDYVVSALKETPGLFYVPENYESELVKYHEANLPQARQTEEGWMADDQPISLTEDNGRSWFGNVTVKVGSGYVTLGKERIELAQMLFNPPNHLGGQDASPQRMIVNSINSTGMDNLWGAVYFSGGSTLWHGFRDRLESEISKIVPGRANEVSVRDHG